jgi:hypothetical protein
VVCTPRGQGAIPSQPNLVAPFARLSHNRQCNGLLIRENVGSSPTRRTRSRQGVAVQARRARVMRPPVCFTPPHRPAITGPVDALEPEQRIGSVAARRRTQHPNLGGRCVTNRDGPGRGDGRLAPTPARTASACRLPERMLPSVWWCTPAHLLVVTAPRAARQQGGHASWGVAGGSPVQVRPCR